MKNLKRTETGKLIVVTEKEAQVVSTLGFDCEIETVEPIEKLRSPIITPTNFPVQVAQKVNPKKTELKTTLLTEDQLLGEMRKAGGKNLSTHQFAILISPCVKKSTDELRHHNWDIAHSHVRGLMRKLVEKGKVSMELDSKTKKPQYIYNLLE